MNQDDSNQPRYDIPYPSAQPQPPQSRSNNEFSSILNNHAGTDRGSNNHRQIAGQVVSAVQNQPEQPGQQMQYGNQQPRQTAVPYDNDDNEGIPRPEPQPQATFYSRPLAPPAPVIPEDVMKKHQESVKKYPDLNLSSGEYVVQVARRHPIGYFQIWGIVVLAILLVFFLIYLYGSTQNSMSGVSVDIITPQVQAGIAAFAIVLGGLGGLLASSVYHANYLVLTNESVIQHMQYSPFDHRTQTVSLGNVEDVSYAKSGILAALFDFGEVRLSTEGDETTYRFKYASEPGKDVMLLNNAVEAFKNGRPIEH